MFSPKELPELKKAIQLATIRDRRLLDNLRQEVRELCDKVQIVYPRSATTVSFVASDGGNNKLVFDPFQVHLIRVVDSYGEQLCLDAVTPTADIKNLSRQQFNDDGSPRTSLGRLMADLGIKSQSLHDLSEKIPSGNQAHQESRTPRRAWMEDYRDLCEWAALYERICYRNFATDTLLVRDGLLRSVLFRDDYFKIMCSKIEKAIERIREDTRRKIFLVGIAKRSRVLDRYHFAIALESVFPAGEPRFVRIPRHLESKVYPPPWPESGSPGFVSGEMYFVRFGDRSGDRIWTADLLPGQSGQADVIFGYLLANAREGFPVPFYPLCLQQAHEYAHIADLDEDILQDEVVNAIRGMLNGGEQKIMDDVLMHNGNAGGR